MELNLSNYKIKVIASNIRTKQLQVNLLKEPKKFHLKHGVAKEFDVALFEVLDDYGSYDRIENIYGRSVRIYMGDYVIGTFGNRHSGQNLCGHISNKDTSDVTFHLLTNGGIIGVCDDSPVYRGAPMRLKCLGIINEENVPVNTLNIEDNIERITPIVMVCGTSGETGKTTVSKDIIRYLKRKTDLAVAGIKISGTGCMEDILEMQDAGSDMIYDLSDAGVISSYTSPANTISAVKTILSKATSNGAKICVCECGGDIICANVNNILQDDFIMKNTIKIVLLYNDIMGVMMAEKLFSEFKVKCEVLLAQNIKHNVFGDRFRLKEWNINFDSFNVNNESEKERLVDNILDEYYKTLPRV